MLPLGQDGEASTARRTIRGEPAAVRRKNRRDVQRFAEGDKTRLKLTHEGIETFPQTPAFARENFQTGWTAIASELQRFVEEGRDREFVISRTFDAPRDLVWKAWTERERLMQWFGPKGFTMPIAKLDFRPGGMLHYCLRSADGKEM